MAKLLKSQPKVDVTKEVEVDAMTQLAVDTFGRIDICHNAGIVISGPTDEFDVNKWRLVQDVNFGDISAKSAVKHMLKNKNGASLYRLTAIGQKRLLETVHTPHRSSAVSYSEPCSEYAKTISDSMPYVQ